jgi:hypothetical protein
MKDIFYNRKHFYNRGHFLNKGHFFEGPYHKGPVPKNIFTRDIYTEGHFFKDKKSETFSKRHSRLLPTQVQIQKFFDQKL